MFDNPLDKAIASWGRATRINKLKNNYKVFDLFFLKISSKNLHLSFCHINHTTTFLSVLKNCNLSNQIKIVKKHDKK